MPIPRQEAANAYADAVLLHLETGRVAAIQAHNRRLEVTQMPKGLNPTDVSMCVSDSYAAYLPRISELARATPRLSNAALRDEIVRDLMGTEFLEVVAGCIEQEPAGFGWDYFPETLPE
ncbi:hypothetical protein B1810_22040 [Panacagrimonas perspica]|uniref:hypothetical protein n=1 Tax=Panacagrimonas perspica TaxID=381431 RepID=UPI00105BDAC1|nr:hypothetical protein [Panacagrimonas perspica]THD00943.1 hypothetical protein B1810_22040 [Panacagrimonas perspica]